MLYGVISWTLAEYTIHKMLFHAEKWIPDNSFCRYLHFMLHGVHHFIPQDP
jgi:4-hydroxysphinganine ceramide fatty acyl 2-hydroxylase